MKRLGVAILADGTGAATVYSPRFTGKIHQIEYIVDGVTPFAAGAVDFTITGEKTGIGIWTESNIAGSTVRAPRQPTHTQVGAALLYAAGGVAQSDKIGLSNDRVKFVIAQAGAAGKGQFYITVD